jgi:hypothetical protein
MSYPEKALVVVTCHGRIPVNRTDNVLNEPDKFAIPKNMKVIKMSSVAPGVCNITSPKDIDTFISTILKNQTEMIEGLQNPEEYIKELVNLYKSIEKETVEEIFNEGSVSDEVENTIRNTYKYHHDKGYKIIKYNNENEFMINKEYLRNNKKEQNSSEWDYGIFCLNARGSPDLMREILEIRTYADTDTIVSLEQILYFLDANGVKETILIDLSCSNLKYVNDDDDENIETKLSDRDIRNQRLSLMKEDLNGGKKDHRKKGTVKKRRLLGRKTKRYRLHKKRVTKKRKNLKNIRFM